LDEGGEVIGGDVGNPHTRDKLDGFIADYNAIQSATSLIPILAAKDVTEIDLAPANHGHLRTNQQAGYKPKTFIHPITLFPGHLRSLPNARLCNLCARHDL